MNCIDCKYFKKIKTREGDMSFMCEDSIAHVKFVELGYGHCENYDKITHGLQDSPETNDLDRLYFEDNESYGVDLIVGPNFGCKHFEAKS